MKLILVLAVFLAGCHNSYDVMNFPTVPAELKDCKFFTLNNTEGNQLRVARCPNSATSTNYQSGKTKRNVIVIDGTEYIEKEKPQ